MLAGLGVPELLVILIVALLIFGPKNLPKLGNALGKTVKSVREGMEADVSETSCQKDTQELAEGELSKTDMANASETPSN